MSIGRVEVRDATRADLEALYPGEPIPTMRAKVAVLDGQPVGVAGVIVSGGTAYIFSRKTEALDAFPVFIWREAVRFMREIPYPARCICDEKLPGAGAFLERLGWEKASSSDGQEIYAWPIR